MYDFVIIGGGIAGISTAAALAPLGSVLVLEAEEHYGLHASGRSAAVFVENYGNPTVRALNTASLPTLEKLDVLSPRGVLLLGRQQDRSMFDAERVDMKMEEIALQEAYQKLPIINMKRCAMAAYSTDAQDIDTDFLLQTYLRRAREAGAVTYVGQQVRAISRNSKGWHIEASGDLFFGTHLINAAGAWADGIAQMAGVAALGILPKRRSMAQLPAPLGQDTLSWPLTIGASGDWYAKPSGAKWIVSPADAKAVEPHDAWADDMVIAEGLARYEAMVTVPVTRVETSWAGLRSFSPDGSLILGPDPHDPQFFWCAAQGGYGFQTAPAAAQLVAELANGRSPSLDPQIVASLAPDRFL